MPRSLGLSHAWPDRLPENRAESPQAWPGKATPGYSEWFDFSSVSLCTVDECQNRFLRGLEDVMTSLIQLGQETAIYFLGDISDKLSNRMKSFCYFKNEIRLCFFSKIPLSSPP